MEIGGRIVVEMLICTRSKPVTGVVRTRWIRGSGLRLDGPRKKDHSEVSAKKVELLTMT